MAKNKTRPEKPAGYAAVLASLKQGFKDTDAVNVIQLLEQQARDAVIEVLSGYLATPDALRELVKDEFAQTVSRDYIGPGYGSTFDTHAIPKAALQKAEELAKEHMETPEFQAQVIEVAKKEYLRAFSERMNQYIRDHAWRDAHAAYQRAFRAPRRESLPKQTRKRTSRGT